MRSQARYESDAAVAVRRRAAARTNEEAVLHDQTAAAYATAGRHVLLYSQWSQRADRERNAAHLGPLYIGGGRGPVDPVAEARGVARAERSAQIAENHRRAADGYDAAASALQTTAARPAAASPSPGNPHPSGNPHPPHPPARRGATMDVKPGNDE